MQSEVSANVLQVSKMRRETGLIFVGVNVRIGLLNEFFAYSR